MESEWRKFFYYPAIKINKFVIGQNGKSENESSKKVEERGFRIERSGWKKLGNRLIDSEMHSA